MKPTIEVSREGLLQPFQMFLRVRRRRFRKGVSLKATEDDREIPPYVRVRWDDSSGPVPLISACGHNANSTTTSAVFQRLPKNTSTPRGQVHTESVLTSSLLLNSKANRVCSTTLHVNTVKRAQRHILIDCTVEDTEAQLGTDEEIKEDFYVTLAGSDKLQKDMLSPTSSGHSEEFDFDKLTVSEEPLPELHSIRQIGKRLRDDSGAMHTFFLVPPRRARLDGDGNAERPSPTWPPICEDHDNTLLNRLQSCEDLAPFILEGSMAAQEDLYCCVDHRKDDEYDSNAEDFSGNDYPESERFRNSISAVDTHFTPQEDNEFSEFHRTSRHPNDYGIFCEPDYLENSLGEGWESDY